MSTKMPNLYIYGGSATELLAFLKELRTEYLASIRRYIRDELGEKMLIHNPVAIYNLMRHETCMNTRSPLNIDVSAVVYLLDGHLPMVQFFGLPSELLDKHLSFRNGPLEDFSYWGNADRPGNVTQEQWENRYKTITLILQEDERPSRAGLTFIFANEDDIYRIIKSAEDRLL